jgi:hypothetical protein
VLSFIVFAVISGCNGKTVSTANGTSPDGAGGGSWSTYDGAAGRAADAAASGGVRSSASGGAGDVASGGARSTTATFDSGSTSTPLPACPNLTTVVDGGSEATCDGWRAYLVCLAVNATAGGAGQTCLSDNADHCPPGPFMVSGPLSCQDRCAPTEYAVGCSGAAFGAPLTVTLPADCREVNGRGGEVYCCPCGS